MQYWNRGHLTGKRLAMWLIAIALLLLGVVVMLETGLSLAVLLMLFLALGLLAGLVWGLSLARRGGMPPELTQLQAGEARFRAMLESLPNIAVQGYDRQRRVVFWNEESANLYGYSEAQAKGRQLEDLIIPEAMRDEVIRRHEAWIVEGRPIPAGRLILRHRSGIEVPVYSYHAMLGEASEDPIMFCVDVPLGRTAA